MQDDELREKLDIRSRLGGLSIFKLGFGFDTYELVEFILADRKKYELQVRIEEASGIRKNIEDLGTPVYFAVQRIDGHINYLKQELASYE